MKTCAMFKLLLRPAILLTLICVVPIALIRAQPYDDSELRAFLTPPDGCPMPCFMGIRPGVTTVDEAIAILEGHEWVASVGEDYVKLMQEISEDELPPLLTTIDWEWNGAQPVWVDSTRNARFFDADREVSIVVINTLIPLGDVLLAYGIPDNARLIWMNSDWFGHQFNYDVWYPTKCMYVKTGALGPPRNIYLQPVEIWFQADPPERDQVILADMGCKE